MSLAPKWSKDATVLGLKIAMLQLRLAYDQAEKGGHLDAVLAGFIHAEIDSYQAQLEMIEEMKL